MSHHPETRDPALLHPSAVLRHIPTPAKDGPEVCAVADAIGEHDGVLIPILIDASNHILTDDSRLRWMGAKRMGLTEVPVTILDSAQATLIALGGLVHRAHYTKSAIAYLTIELAPNAAAEARAHRMKYLKSSIKPIVHGVHYSKTWQDLAEKFGVCRRLLGSALAVHAAFDRDKKKYLFIAEGGPDDGAEVEQTLREHFEPKILRQQVDSEHAAARPIGLGAVMKAIGSIRATKGVHKRTDSQLELFTEGLGTAAKRLRYWSEMSAVEKESAQERFLSFLDALPAELKRIAHDRLDMDSTC